MRRKLTRWALAGAAGMMLQTIVSCDGGRFGPAVFFDRGPFFDSYGFDVFPVYDTFYYDEYYFDYYDDYYYDDVYYYDDFYFDGYYYY